MKINKPCYVQAFGLTSNYIKEILDNLGENAIGVQWGNYNPVGTVVIPYESPLATIDKYLGMNCVVITATGLVYDNMLTYYPVDCLTDTGFNGNDYVASTTLSAIKRSGSSTLSYFVYGEYAAELTDLTVNSRFSIGRILIAHATKMYGRNYFHKSHFERNRHLYSSTVVYSDYHACYIDREQDDLHCGYWSEDTDDESSWFVNCSAVYVDENDTWYYNGSIAEAHGFVYNDRTGDWGTEVTTARYHSLSRVFRFSHETPKFSIGFEIEKEDKEAYSIEATALYRDTEWIKEADSSLDRSIGYELVSPAFDMFSHQMEDEISRSEDLQQLINAKSSTNCGGHINIASSEYNTKELFEGLSAFMPLLYSMYESRIDKHYSMAKEKHQYLSSDADKYAAVFIKRNVLEIRIFSAVKSIENLLWRQDLVRIMCKNINKSETDVLKMLCNQKSNLYKHLRKVYTQAEIINKIGMFVTFSRNFNHKKLSFVDLTDMPVDGLQDSNSLGA
jgi:hypothetical protein